MTILKSTNQLWKLYVFVVSMAVGAGVTLFQTLLYRVLEKEIITFLVIGGMMLVIGVFVWANASILCPNCNLKLFRYSIIKVGLGTWFTWLVNLEKCPECGSLDGLPAPNNKRGRSKRKEQKP